MAGRDSLQDFDVSVDELNEQHPKAAQPPSINVRLKDHQLTLLQRCIDYEAKPLQLRDYSRFADNAKYAAASCNTRIGILADRVGSGKSYVILGLIISNDVTGKENTIIKSDRLNKVVFFIPDTKRVVRTNLLLIPHTICQQWELAIKTFSSSLKYKVINRQKYVNDMYDEAFDIESYDLIVVTGTFYDKVARYLNQKNIKVQRMFVDEVDSISVTGCYTVEACFTWYVTASYGNLLYPRGFHQFDPESRRYVYYATGFQYGGYIRNMFMELYQTLSRDYIRLLVVKNRESYVETSLALPDINTITVRCNTPYALRILNGIADRNIIECLNGNDVSGAIKFISPNHKGSEANIIELLIEKYTKQISNNNMIISSTEGMFFDTDQERDAELARLRAKNEGLQNKIDQIKDRVKSSENCVICYDDAVNKSITECCQNTYCFECITKWLKTKASCPFCKAHLTSDNLLVVDDNFKCEKVIEEQPDYNVVSDKFDKQQNLDVILRTRKEGSKFLICSSYDSSFVDVESILMSLRIPFEYLKGPGAQIASTVRKYKGGGVDVLLVNIVNYGCGLNLENTTDVIMFHKFDTQIEGQVIGRAQRLGRTAPLNVHYLLYENEA